MRRPIAMQSVVALSETYDSREGVRGLDRARFPRKRRSSFTI